jgi:hypothetical protein
MEDDSSLDNSEKIFKNEFIPKKHQDFDFYKFNKYDLIRPKSDKKEQGTSTCIKDETKSDISPLINNNINITQLNINKNSMAELNLTNSSVIYTENTIQQYQEKYEKISDLISKLLKLEQSLPSLLIQTSNSCNNNLHNNHSGITILNQDQINNIYLQTLLANKNFDQNYNTLLNLQNLMLMNNYMQGILSNLQYPNLSLKEILNTYSI